VCRKSPLPTSKSALNSGERAVACRKQPSKVDILRSCGMCFYPKCEAASGAQCHLYVFVLGSTWAFLPLARGSPFSVALAVALAKPTFYSLRR
jgi:hypothetical protein